MTDLPASALPLSGTSQPPFRAGTPGSPPAMDTAAPTHPAIDDSAVTTTSASDSPSYSTSRRAKAKRSGAPASGVAGTTTSSWGNTLVRKRQTAPATGSPGRSSQAKITRGALGTANSSPQVTNST